MPLSFLSCDWMSGMKEGSSFPPHENNPVFQNKANSCGRCVFAKNLKWCLPQEGQGFAQNITEKLKWFLQIREAAVWVRSFVFHEIGFYFDNGNVCFGASVCNGRFYELGLSILCFCLALQKGTNHEENATLETHRWKKKTVERNSRRLREKLTCV